MAAKIYTGEYKNGFIGKKKVKLEVFEKFIKGNGVEYYLDKFIDCYFSVNYEDIKKVEIREIKNIECLVIEYVDVESKSLIQDYTIVFPNLKDIEEALLYVHKMYNREIEEKAERDRVQFEREQKQLLEKRQYEEESRKYYEQCFDFHIINNNNPYYELKKDNLHFVGIYIDKNKSMNFLSIDGYSKDENNAIIPYEKIHYYEKAGSIHYVSEVNGNYSSFGGSFYSGSISKKTTAIAGLLFGPMGMAMGALFTHKPSEYKSPTVNLNISSETIKIDDRSVILNYYSDIKQQLMDIELPEDIYNFLQTYLPEKKYGIVVELEKRQVLDKHGQMKKNVEGNGVIKIEQDDIMQAFENKLNKLTMMREKGILSDVEFEQEKRKLLAEI